MDPPLMSSFLTPILIVSVLDLAAAAPASAEALGVIDRVRL